jgi:serine/threonine protein kinase
MSDRYTIERCIMVIETGSLHIAYDTVKDMKVVIKTITIETTGFASKLLEEVISLYSLRPYPYFCEITDHFIKGSGNMIDSINIVTKFYPKGNLCENLIERGKSKHYFSEDELLKHVSSLLTGCSIMQKLGISHRDLKPDNILINDDNSLLISDLGASCLIESSSTIRGSPSYLSPEMRTRLHNYLNNSLLEDFNDFDLNKSDVWSLGVTFLFMVTLEPQTDFQNNDGLESRIREKLIKVNINIIRELISQMLVFDPKSRKDFIFLNDWFQSRTQNRFRSETSLIERLGRHKISEESSDLSELDENQNNLQISNQIPISIEPVRPFSVKPLRRSISKLPSPSCKNCGIGQDFHVCSNCSLIIHTPCLDSAINLCPKCQVPINYKDFNITCEICFNTFKGNQVRSCCHRRCPECQIINKDCRYCLGFNIFSVQPFDTSLFESFPCGSCEKQMSIVGKVMICEKDQVENCIGCKRRPHQDSCIRYNNRPRIPCIRCEEAINLAEPSMIVHCKNCALVYCYVCSKGVNEKSHLNCARIYSSFN